MSWLLDRRHRRFAARLVSDRRFRLVGAAQVHAAEQRQWTDTEVAIHRRSLLAEVLHAACNTAYYSRAVSGDVLAGIADVRELAALPLLARNALRADTAQFVNSGLPIEQMDVTFTSGTHGSASHVLRSVSTLRQRAVCERRWYHGLGLPWVFDLMCATPWPGAGRQNTAVRDPRVGYAERGLDEVVDRLNSGASVGQLLLAGPDMLPVLADRVTDWRDTSVVATSFEVLQDDHARAWRRPGLPALAQMYCAAEISVPLAFSFPGCVGMHANIDYLHLEVVDDNGNPLPHGVPGRLAVSDLVNDAMPLLRYLIGDAAVLRPPRACGCGRALPILDVLGRFPHPDGRIGDARVDTLLAALAAATAREFLLERRSEHDLVVHLADDNDRSPVLDVLRPHVPEAMVRTELLGPRLRGLAHDRGRFLVTAPRHPYRPGHKEVSMPHRLRALDTHGYGGGEAPAPRSARSAARRLLRDRYHARGATSEIPIVDASRSMAPLWGSATRVTVQWGVPDPAAAVGTIVLLELPQDILAAHRVADWCGSAGHPRLLQFADNYDRHNQFSAFWVPLDTVLGTITAATVDSGKRTHTVELTGPRARRAGQLVALADRALWSVHQRRGPLVLELAAHLAQRAVFHATSRLLRHPTQARDSHQEGSDDGSNHHPIPA